MRNVNLKDNCYLKLLELCKERERKRERDLLDGRNFLWLEFQN